MVKSRLQGNVRSTFIDNTVNLGKDRTVKFSFKHGTITDKTVTRMIKIKLKLTPQLRLHINRAIQVVQYLYNKCVELSSSISKNQITLKSLRTMLLNSRTNTIPQNLRSEHEKVPYDIRDEALRDFIKAITGSKLPVMV